jgi:C-terminal processing protease CtpA/Prc
VGDVLLDYLYDRPFNQFDSCRFKISPETMAQLKEQAGEQDSLYIMMAAKPVGSLVPVPIPRPVRHKGIENRYTGNVYLLIGNFSGSAAVSFAAAFKKYKVGKIIGQETGGLTYSFGDLYSFELPYSKIYCSVSTKIFACAGGKNDGHGVLPDYPIAVNPENDQEDPEMEFVLKLIQDGRQK